MIIDLILLICVFYLYWNREIPIIHLLLLLRIYVNSNKSINFIANNYCLVYCLSPYRLCVLSLNRLLVDCVFSLYWNLDVPIIYLVLLLRIMWTVLDKTVSIVSIFISYNSCSELRCVCFLCIGTEIPIIRLLLLLRIYVNSLMGV